MSFQQGLSGLNATSKNLEVIGNNIANASTFGAKSARAEFSDFYAAALNGSTAQAAGIGVRLSAVAQQFTQGSITATDNPMDVAINGRGFFQVSDGASPTKYSRNGQFKVDRDGYLVNNTGLKLLGYSADPGTGQIQPGLAVPLQLPTAGVSPQATTAINMQMNLDSTKSVTLPAAAPLIDFADAATYNNATSLTVYDGKGQPVALTYYFQRSDGPTQGNPAAPDEWNVYITANGETVGGTAAAPDPVLTITFAADGSAPTATTLGAINSSTNKIELTLPDITAGPVADNDSDPTNNVMPLTLSGVELTIDVTQFAAPFGVTDMNQDGFSAGQLVSVGIEDNGILTARYSNGQTKAAGQIEVANFRNVQGLQPVGDNMWSFTFASGDPVTGVPGEGNLGVLQAGALEESNVDLTAELVNMITAQRAYQANAQTIKTMDQALQTLVNLR
ncbi:MAG: flagellar hook protein FlgE [Rubrivivax sp.]|nr:flagellar hook protein FlgE [Rubrivivax sp.]